MILERHALVDINWNDLCPKAEWQAAQDKKKGQRGGGLVVSKEGLLRHIIQPYCNVGWQQIGWSCDRCRAWARKPQALEIWGWDSCAKVGEVGPAGKAAVLAGPRASHHESWVSALVPEVWNVHRIFPQRVENEVRG